MTPHDIRTASLAGKTFAIRQLLLSSKQREIVNAINDFGEYGMTVMEIANAMGVSRHAIKSLLILLQDKGYIVAKTSEGTRQGRRRYLYSIRPENKEDIL